MHKLKVKSWKVVIFSVVALGLLVAALITRQWLFALGGIILMVLNQYELMKARKGNKK